MKLIKFETDNCTPCKMVDSVLLGKSVEVERINVEENKELTKKFEIMSVPVLILLDENGEEVKRSKGFNLSEIEEILKLM